MLNTSLMKFYSAIFLLLICFNISTAQDKAAASQERASTPQDRALPAESSVITNSQVTIKGKAVPYKVTAGTQPVWDRDGKVIASLYYTYYERSDLSDKSRRPLVFSFNGEAGSASVCTLSVYHEAQRLLIR